MLHPPEEIRLSGRNRRDALPDVRRLRSPGRRRCSRDFERGSQEGWPDPAARTQPRPEGPRQTSRKAGAIQSNLRETTTRVLASLTPREERVLRMRFGIGMNTDHTLEEVGQQFSVTRERIRQIEAKALRKLKHPSRSRKLRSFLDS